MNRQYYQALGDLDALLKKHKPTYEALLLHAKLLHHFGRLDVPQGRHDNSPAFQRRERRDPISVLRKFQRGG